MFIVMVVKFWPCCCGSISGSAVGCSRFHVLCCIFCSLVRFYVMSCDCVPDRGSLTTPVPVQVGQPNDPKVGSVLGHVGRTMTRYTKTSET